MSKGWKSILTFHFLLFFVFEVQASDIDGKKNGGLSFGIIPVFSYDADLKFKYGAVVNLFEYKPSKNQTYVQYLNLKLTNTTKNTLNMQGVLETNKLIPSATTFIEASYTNDEKLDFFGFNGIETVYNDHFIQPEYDQFINRGFYSQDRKWIRFRTDIQKNIIGNRFRLLTGITYNKFVFELPDNEEEHSNQQKSLYQNYIDWHIIDEKEKTGGNTTYLSLGLIYDTRNDKINSTSGQWMEGILIFAPKKINQQPFTKLVLTYRYYYSFQNSKYTLSFRLSSQNRLSGKLPYYLLPVYFDSQLNQDGLGGCYTMRGVSRNRLVADGFVLGNFEARMNFKEFHWLKQDIMFGTTLFCDLAYLTQRYKFSTADVPAEYMEKLFNQTPQQLHMGLGPGVNLIVNKNNIVTVNYGLSPNKQLGKGGFYVGSRFLF